MSSGTLSDQLVSKVTKKTERLKRRLVRKLQNFNDILINHSININNIFDDIVRFYSEIDFRWLSLPFLGSSHTSCQGSTS